MRFGVDGDNGATVTGWVIPDHPSVRPMLDVVVGGRRRFRWEAGLPRPELVAAGLHATGLCGFAVDTLDPGGSGEVELYEARANVLIYRRPRAGMVALRLFHLEPRVDPDPPLASELRRLAQMSYSGLEFLGEETLATVLSAGHSGSLLAVGAVSPRRVERHLRENGFRRSVLLPDPHDELAARLIRAQRVGRTGGGEGGWRTMGAGSLPARLAPVDLADVATLRRALRSLGDDEVRWLADPATRLLAGTARDEPLARDALAQALEVLAGFDLIGHAGAPGPFRASLAALYGVPPLPAPAARSDRDRTAVTLAVRASREAADLIAADLALYDASRDASTAS